MGRGSSATRRIARYLQDFARSAYCHDPAELFTFSYARRSEPVIRFLALGCTLSLCLIACAPSSHVLVGTARPPISAADVKIYLRPPPTFEDIAILNASADSMFGTGGQATVDKVIARLKEEAAKLGANGLILEDISDQQTGAIGGGSSSASVSNNSAVGVGLGGSLGIYKKTGHARAVYVPPAVAPAAPPQ